MGKAVINVTTNKINLISFPEYFSGLDVNYAWVETVQERRVMIRAFEKTGISLKVDGLEDAEKMKFQGQKIGIPTGLDI